MPSSSATSDVERTLRSSQRHWIEWLVSGGCMSAYIRRTKSQSGPRQGPLWRVRPPYQWRPVAALPDSYLDAHRYGGAALVPGGGEGIVQCAIQPRDFQLVHDVWRYKFLTAPQLHELFWPGESAWPAQRRLRKLFLAGLLERFRPLARRGSFPWTYQLGEQGHRLLRDSGV